MLFSIIIPVYNNASYLCDAVDSVLQQSYTEFELFLVDDESTDDSSVICQRYADEYNNVKYIRIDHSGPGAARNAGLQAARGDYILFMDADDYWLDFGLLEKIRRQIDSLHPDVIMYQIIQIKENGALIIATRKLPFPDQDKSYILKEVYSELVKNGQVMSSACNKCVSKRLIDQYNIIFWEGITGEDIDWVLKVFSYIKTISFLNDEAYAYRQYPSSARASNSKNGAHNLAVIIRYWAKKLKHHKVPNQKAVAGILAYEYGIFMGYSHQVSPAERKLMKRYQYLLRYCLDKKTRMIAAFYKYTNYNITCLAVRCYLLIRWLLR